jgi:hypothetical protein
LFEPGCHYVAQVDLLPWPRVLGPQACATISSHLTFLYSKKKKNSESFLLAFYFILFYFAVLGLELRAFSFSHSTSPFLWQVFF